MRNDIHSYKEYIATLPDWQRDNLQKFRSLILEVEPKIIEDIKWGVPVFILDKRVVFTMAAFKSHTKYNFILNGAVIDDNDHLFNNGMESTKSRSIDMTENDSIDDSKLKTLIQKALA